MFASLVCVVLVYIILSSRGQIFHRRLQSLSVGKPPLTPESYCPAYCSTLVVFSLNCAASLGDLFFFFWRSMLCRFCHCCGEPFHRHCWWLVCFSTCLRKVVIPDHFHDLWPSSCKCWGKLLYLMQTIPRVDLKYMNIYIYIHIYIYIYIICWSRKVMINLLGRTWASKWCHDTVTSELWISVQHAISVFIVLIPFSRIGKVVVGDFPECLVDSPGAAGCLCLFASLDKENSPELARAAQLQLEQVTQWCQDTRSPLGSSRIKRCLAFLTTERQAKPVAAVTSDGDDVEWMDCLGHLEINLRKIVCRQHFRKQLHWNARKACLCQSWKPWLQKVFKNATASSCCIWVWCFMSLTVDKAVQECHRQIHKSWRNAEWGSDMESHTGTYQGDAY